ncbi:hypothetical protein OESDEN_01660 [Oesophagostomum dentatum]|uniref:FAT domain-containing protein n=1 Tax=Oesophagostomum dentatum TaxID=61180 RepID=A0A0B1TSH1_OESDE|nr:hypothetical protein OESDEN_01660 [Oesophagostomum dentatum]
MSRGSPAINCYFEAARIENETRARKYIARLPQLVTELQQRPSSGFIHILERIASVYPLQVVSALRPVLDAEIFVQIIENVSKKQPVPVLPDDHKFSALSKVLEKACNARLTDVRMWNRLLCGFSRMREFWAERHLRYASQLKDEVLRYYYSAISVMGS